MKIKIHNSKGSFDLKLMLLFLVHYSAYGDFVAFLLPFNCLVLSIAGGKKPKNYYPYNISFNVSTTTSC